MALGVVAGASVFSSLFGAVSCAPSGGKVIGLQLYSLRESMKEDVPGTLEAVAQMGYTTLETAGYNGDNGEIYGYTPKKFKELAEGFGLKVTGAHCGKRWDASDEEAIMQWWDKALDAHKAAGCTYVIMPSFPIGETLADVKVYVDYFNAIADKAAAKGLKFGFHNHAREFEKRDDKVIFDYMVENSNDNMIFELDVYWVTKGGCDPVEYINRYPSKIKVLHIKDESIIGDSGDMKFKEIFEAAYSHGIKDFYVEVERYTLPPETCVERSFEYLDISSFVK